jgi:hypothetical protein
LHLKVEIRRNIYFMNRQHRIFSALLLIVSLLFTQLAVAAYACPMMLRGAVIESAAPVPTDASDSMPCQQDRAAEPALCKAHCTDAERTVRDLSVDAPIVFVAAFIVALPPLGATSFSSASEFSPGLTHALAPPLAIAHCCLRI